MKDIQIADRLLLRQLADRNDDVDWVQVVRFFAAKPQKT
jgi:hypothetical protein